MSGKQAGLISIIALACFGCMADGPLRPSANTPPRIARPQQPSAANQFPEKPPSNKQPPPPDPPPTVSIPATLNPSARSELTVGGTAPAGLAQIRQLYRQAAESYASIDSYIARLRRREQVNGKDGVDEVMLFKFRKRPWSVYLKWLGQEGAGREVVYVKGQHDDKIHTLLAAGDMPLAPAGRRIALSPDNILVRSASRHPIYEAGVGPIIERIGGLVEANERGTQRLGTATYLSNQRRAEFPNTVLEAIDHVIPPGADALLPKGGRRFIYFDPAHRLPILVITLDDRGKEVEYYCYDRLQYPVKLDDDDFNPDKLWVMKPKR